MNSLQLHGAFLIPDDDRFRMQQINQQRHDAIQTPGERQRRRLHGETIGVAIDDESAESVGFAEHEPGRALGIGIAEIAPQGKRRFQAMAPECIVERVGGRPGIQPHPQPALAVVQAPRNEPAFVGNQIDRIAIDRVAVDSRDRRIQHPGMPAEERPHLARFQMHLGDAHAGVNLRGATTSLASSRD